MNFFFYDKSRCRCMSSPSFTLQNLPLLKLHSDAHISCTFVLPQASMSADLIEIGCVLFSNSNFAWMLRSSTGSVVLESFFSSIAFQNFWENLRSIRNSNAAWKYWKLSNNKYFFQSGMGYLSPLIPLFSVHRTARIYRLSARKWRHAYLLAEKLW